MIPVRTARAGEALRDHHAGARDAPQEQEAEAQHGAERIMLLMERNEPLYEAYLVKEDLRLFWISPDVAHLQAFPG